MANIKKTTTQPTDNAAKSTQNNADNEFASDLIRAINKEAGSTIAFNLSTDDAPTNIKRWISSGSKQLDFILSNKKEGGFPEGRIIEIQGPASSGKSHIAYEICKSTQKLGGIVVYIDTENATSLENLKSVGVDVGPKFVFIQETCMEEIFKIIENVIEKARSMKANVPVTVVWDSIAASAPKAEIEGDYDQNTIGLAARILSKGFRKITHVIGDKNVLLVLLNQQRQKIGCVSPETMVHYCKNQQQIQNGTMRQLFGDVGLDFEKMPINEPVSVDGLEIATIDKDGKPAWRKVLHAVRKPNAPHMQVTTGSDFELDYSLNHRLFVKSKQTGVTSYQEVGGFELDCSPNHRLFVKNKQTGATSYQEVVDLENTSKAFLVRTSFGWEQFDIKSIDGNIEIADIEVEGEHSYLSNEILSHNTIYGDPTCVSPDTKIKIRKRVSN